MSAEDSPTRFVVFFGELPRFWSYTEKGAELLRTDGWRLMYDPADEKSDNPVKLLDPKESCIKEIEEKEIESLESPTHNEKYIFYADGHQVGCPDGGWVGCPECGRVWMGIGPA